MVSLVPAEEPLILCPFHLRTRALVTDSNAEEMKCGWTPAGRTSQQHPRTCTYSSRGGHLGRYVIHTKEGILPVREKGSKSKWETNERKTRLCSEQPLLERYFLFASSAATHQKGCATQGHGKPWRDQVPMNFPAFKSKQAHDFKPTKRHYCSLPDSPPNILGSLYKNSIFLVGNSNTSKSLGSCAYSSHLHPFHM